MITELISNLLYTDYYLIDKFDEQGMTEILPEIEVLCAIDGNLGFETSLRIARKFLELSSCT